MKKLIIRFFSNRLAVFITFIVFFLVILSTLLYRSMGSKATLSLTQQFLDRQQSVAKTGANSIASLIEITSKSLVLLTKDDDLAFITDNTQKQMQAFIDNWSSTPVIVILRIDSHGNRVVAATNFNQVQLKGERNLSKSKCIKWAETAQPGKVCISDPSIPDQEEAKQFGHLFSLVTPIHINGQYNGSLVLGISLNKLTKNYLDTLRITDGTIVSILTSDGNIIYSDNPNYLNKNLLELFRENIFLGSTSMVDSLEQLLKTNEADSKDVAVPPSTGSQIQRMLLAYAPIQINDDHWTLITRTPYSQALQMIAPFYTREIGIIITGFLILLLFTVTILSNRSFIYKKRQKTLNQANSSKTKKK